MAIIQDNELFVWNDFELSSDLSRISMILSSIPDENLMKILEDERGSSGVNTYPIRTVWNSLLVGIITGHPTIESLRREM